MSVDIEAKDSAGDGSEIIVRRQVVIPPKYRDDWSRVIFAMEDTTQRKRAEGALRESEARLSSFINNIPNSIYLKDTEGRYVLVNDSAKKLYGLPDNQLIGKTVYDIHPKGEADAAAKQDREVLKHGVPIEAEHELTFPDGSKHTIIAVKFPVRGDSGEIIGVGGRVVEDASD